MVETVATTLPTDAQMMRRLIGLRNVGNHQKLTKMKTQLMSEMTENVRSTTPMVSTCAAVRPALWTVADRFPESMIPHHAKIARDEVVLAKRDELK